MKMRILVILTVTELLLGSSQYAYAETQVRTEEKITFEGLTGRDYAQQIFGPYAGFNWSNVWAMGKDEYKGANNGYEAVVHGVDLAYGFFTHETGFSLAAPGLFSLRSGHFAAAWVTGLRVKFKAYRKGALVGTQRAKVDSVDTLIKFDSSFHYIDKVVIEASGGHCGEQCGTQLAWDNLVVSFVPSDGH